MHKVLTNKALRIPLKIRLLRCYPFNILFYGIGSMDPHWSNVHDDWGFRNVDLLKNADDIVDGQGDEWSGTTAFD